MEPINDLLQTCLDPKRIVDQARAHKYQIIRNICKAAMFTPNFEKMILEYCRNNRNQEYMEIEKLDRVIELTKKHFPDVSYSAI